MQYFDTHTHAISNDTIAFPPAPLGGTRSEWSQERHVDIDGLLRALDDAGVEQAVLVHASTVYGFDNRYVSAALSEHRDRFVGVGSVDFLSATAVDDLRRLIEDDGLSGVRIRVSDGTTRVPTPGSGVTDERMTAIWDYVHESRIPVCVQMHSKDAPKLAEVLKTRPGLTILLDHLGRPDTSGVALDHLDELGQLACFGGVHLKITPPALQRFQDAPGVDPTAVLARLIEIFGSDRLMWGSNYPASAGTLASLIHRIESTLPPLPDAAREAILGGNAARIYSRVTAG